MQAPTHEHPPGGRVLEARGLSMRFGAVLALDRVDFELRAGEVHALMGENGAGKSTLIKCLTGVHTPTAGRVLVRGREVRPRSPREAESAGVATVYQEVGLIPHLSVAENICLGREPRRRFLPLIDWSTVKERARTALARLGVVSLDLNAPVGTCSIAVQQLVAIARALDIDAAALILDEPTSSLDRGECARLFDVLRHLRNGGLGIVFITHFLDQVEAIADRVTVLRDGRQVGVRPAASLSRSELVSLMVGRDVGPSDQRRPAAQSDPSRPTALAARGLGRARSLEHVDLDVAEGECLGLAGLLGSGRTETARVLFGLDKPDRGELRVRGRVERFNSPRDAIAAGLALTPENRKTEGVIPSLSVKQNIVLALQARRGLFRQISESEQDRLVEGFISKLGIKTADAGTPISMLSGGNQQKALLARWLAIRPAVLILDEPTRGIDVVAKQDILGSVHDLLKSGTAVVLISSELEEVVRSCDRVVVMRDRRSVSELSGDQISENAMLAEVARSHA